MLLLLEHRVVTCKALIIHLNILDHRKEMQRDHVIYDVIVVGAGISGMTAAYNLKKKLKKVKILILEAKERTGGRTKTIELNSASGKSKWDCGGMQKTH